MDGSQKQTHVLSHQQRGFVARGNIPCVCVCLYVHVCVFFARLQPFFPAFIYSLAALFTPFSPLKDPL